MPMRGKYSSVVFEFDVQSPRHVRLRIGRVHLRTWRSRFMLLPKGYRAPELVYSVEQQTGEGESVGQLGAFYSERAATRCRSQLEAEGFTNLCINLIPVHVALDDWEFDR